MPDEHRVYLPWYEASVEGLDEWAQVKRAADQLRDREDRRD